MSFWIKSHTGQWIDLDDPHYRPSGRVPIVFTGCRVCNQDVTGIAYKETEFGRICEFCETVPLPASVAMSQASTEGQK